MLADGYLFVHAQNVRYLYGRVGGREVSEWLVGQVFHGVEFKRSDAGRVKFFTRFWVQNIPLFILFSNFRYKVKTCHTRDVSCVKSLSSVLFATGSFDFTVKLWNVSQLTCVATLRGHFGGVNSLVLTLSQHLATSSDDKTIRIWNTSSGQCVRVLKGHGNSVRCLRVNAFTGELFSVSADQQNYGDHSVKVWDTDSGKCLRTLHTTYYIHTIEICSDILN